jgi:hypothetical protein
VSLGRSIPKQFLPVAALLLLVSVSAFSRDIQTVEGKLEIANNMFVIVADKERTGRSDFDKSLVKSRRLMLIGYPSEQVAALTKLAGKRVRANGVIGQAFTRYHTEPLILAIEGLPREIK